MIIDKILAIDNLVPNANFEIIGETIVSHKGKPVPSEAEIDAEMARMKAEWDLQEYARNRVSEYPPIAEQQDMQFHDAIDGTTTWQDAIQAVKNKYPKPE